MPDWSYHPFFRPLLFSLPSEQARDLALGAMGTLARTPFGPRMIEIMGHMAPSERLQLSRFGVEFPSPLGLSAGLDARHIGTKALAKFGFGFLELGPVTVEPMRAVDKIGRDAAREEIYYPEPLANIGLDALVKKVAQFGELPAVLAVRLGHRPGASAAEATRERVHLIHNLARHVQFFTMEILEEEWTLEESRQHLLAIGEALRDPHIERPILLTLTPGREQEGLVEAALEASFDGVQISDLLPDGEGVRVGRASQEPCLELVRALRERHPDLPILAAGGVHEPQDALNLLDAGADLVQIHSGLVFSGPGLPKRTNEAIDDAAQTGQRSALSNQGWRWIALLGIGMLIGGVLAWWVAVTRVVLPYDEAFLGLTRAQIDAINPHLLDFMSHDRISLAGTMISIGILYFSLGRFALRRGDHWAYMTMLASGLVGFGSFFLFIGYGYFDKLHFALSGLLLPLFILGIFLSRYRPVRPAREPNTRNTRQWKRSQTGQLMFVLTGGALTVAGIVISIIGVTHVFVPEDLEFMGTTAAALQAADPQLVPLIAHDRAGFGGALASDGLAVLLIALWGFRQGERWLWWTLLLGGLPGFIAGIGIHLVVGYVDFWHLAPVFLALAWFITGLVLTYPYLCTKKV